MNIRNTRLLKRNLIFVASMTLVTLAFVGILWLRPIVLGLYYQMQGGKQLREVLQDAGIAEDISCSSSPLTDRTAIQDLEQTISLLKNAMQHDSSLMQTYLLLGRSYCWLGKYQEASRYYEGYTELNPKNPLGHLELGFSLAALNTLNRSPNTKERILQEWLAAGYKPDDYISLADQAFKQHLYPQAESFYFFGAISNDNFLSTHTLRWTISSVISYGQIPLQAELDLPIQVYELDHGSLQIEAEEMIWTRDAFHNWEPYGKALKTYPTTDPNIGAMWWSGPAIAFVKIPEDGLYQISIFAQEISPVPIKLQLEENLTPVTRFSLEKQDWSWRSLDTELFLPAGIHIIGIRLMNDETFNGVDINAMIDYVKLQSKP